MPLECCTGSPRLAGLVSVVIPSLPPAAGLALVFGLTTVPAGLGVHLGRVQVYDEAEVRPARISIATVRTFASRGARGRFGTFLRARRAADRASGRLGITPAATRFS